MIQPIASMSAPSWIVLMRPRRSPIQMQLKLPKKAPSVYLSKHFLANARQAKLFHCTHIATVVPWIVELCVLVAPVVVSVSICGNVAIQDGRARRGPATPFCHPNRMYAGMMTAQICALRSLLPRRPRM